MRPTFKLLIAVFATAVTIFAGSAWASSTHVAHRPVSAASVTK
jgi:hypothetical protein